MLDLNCVHQISHDYIWLLYGFDMPLPAKRILDALATIPSATFVETGSYHGSGIHYSHQAGFTKVVSIEPVEEFYELCSKKFAEQITKGSIKLVLGSSEEKLSEVISQIDSPIVYWLDGHFQGADSSAKNCPLSDEVDSILSRGIFPSDVVMVDDIRLIREPGSWKGHDTNLETELGRLILAAPDHMGLFLKGLVEADIFTLIPRWFAGLHSDLFDRQL